MDSATRDKHAYTLFNLHGCEVYVGLESFTMIKPPVPEITGIGIKKPSFKNLEQADFTVLRYWLFEGENDLQTYDWAETLMRFSEINQNSLMEKARIKFQSRSKARLFLLEMSAFLLDFYFMRKDLRFLNTVLKLIDLPGLFTRHTISKDLAGNIDQISIALLQIRVMLMSRAALHQLANKATV